MSLFSAVCKLLFIMDPLGNIPLFISILNNVPENKRIWIILRELAIALVVMLFILFFGDMFLSSLNIHRSSLGVAGGIILFLIAIKMIFPMKNDSLADDHIQDPFIVPLAVPLVAGPSTMTFILIMVSHDPVGMAKWTVAVLVASVINAAVLMLSYPISRVLGPRVMTAITRLMGMILATISVQMFMTGLAQFLAK